MKAEILAALRESHNYISGQELCEKFGVSRTAIWKAINQLKKEGYEIEAVTNRGYRIVSVPDLLSENEIKSRNKTQWLGKQVYYFEMLDSTNIKANHLAEEESSNHGGLVVAEQQEQGKGRRGRGWVSNAHDSIYMSLILKPEIEPGNASMLTLVAAMAVQRGITRVTGLNAAIKWPNDIVISGKKICGILTEMSAQIDYVNHVIVGIGINVRQTEFTEELAQMATSLWLESGQHYNRAEIIEAVLEEFEIYYEKYIKTQDLTEIVHEYDKCLANRGQKVKVLDPKGQYEGVAQGITRRGELMVDTWESRKLVSSGEVSVRGIYGYV